MDHEQGIGQTLKSLRVAAGLSREQLAVKAGVSGSTIIRAELGKNIPYAVSLRRIADALGVTVARLLGEPEVAA